jgi:serine/threonine-protein kinase HipA
LNLNQKQINSVYKRLGIWLPNALQLIEDSFLNAINKQSYKELIIQRVNLLK